jgi:hypothetical protein
LQNAMQRCHHDSDNNIDKCTYNVQRMKYVEYKFSLLPQNNHEVLKLSERLFLPMQQTRSSNSKARLSHKKLRTVKLWEDLGIDGVIPT